jgi:hypothetical protein
VCVCPPKLSILEPDPETGGAGYELVRDDVGGLPADSPAWGVLQEMLELRDDRR